MRGPEEEKELLVSWMQNNARQSAVFSIRKSRGESIEEEETKEEKMGRTWRFKMHKADHVAKITL
jgi:hypothetical protein